MHENSLNVSEHKNQINYNQKKCSITLNIYTQTALYPENKQ